MTATRTLFNWDAQAQAYTSTEGDGAHDRIVYDSAKSRWIWTEGSSLRQEEYDNNKGQLQVIRDLKSGVENTLKRNSNGLLQSVMTQAGDGLIFKYDGTGASAKLLQLWTLEGGVEKSQVRYRYDGLQRLERIEVDLTPDNGWDDNNLNAAKSFITTYEYADDTPKIKRASRGFTQSDGFEVSYDYYTDGPNKDRVKTLIVGSSDDGSAQRVDFTYDTINRTTSVTDAAGRSWTYKYDAQGQIIEILSPAESGQRQLTTLAYNAAGDLTRVVDAEGRINYEYDARGFIRARPLISMRRWVSLPGVLGGSHGSSSQSNPMRFRSGVLYC